MKYKEDFETASRNENDVKLKIAFYIRKFSEFESTLERTVQMLQNFKD